MHLCCNSYNDADKVKGRGKYVKGKHGGYVSSAESAMGQWGKINENSTLIVTK